MCDFFPSFSHQLYTAKIALYCAFSFVLCVFKRGQLIFVLWVNEGVASRADKAAFPALRRVKATRALSKAQTAFVLLFHKEDVWELCARSALKVGWLLLKCSTVNKGFNGVETKSGMNSTHFKHRPGYWRVTTYRYF